MLRAPLGNLESLFDILCPTFSDEAKKFQQNV